MGDKSLRGRGLLGGQRKGGSIPRSPHPEPKRSKRRGGARQAQQRIKTFEEEVNAGPTEGLGLWASGGGEKKPHSTKSGRLSAARNLLNRAWGQKYTNKKNGTPV